MDIPALGADGEYRPRKHDTVRDCAGAAVAELSMVAPLYIARTVDAQRQLPPLPPAQRCAALAQAREVFGGAGFDDYLTLASRVSGLPITVTRAGAQAVLDGLATAFDAIEPARPTGAVLDRRSIGGGAVWARRGEVLGVHASGNAPGVHGLWPQALLLGYRVAVRPSRREPFTGHRLVQALRASGFRPGDVTYLPTGHDGADELIAAADLSMVYGGADVVDKYAGDATVFPNGPGRAKILITAEQDWRAHLDVVVDSIAAVGGTACVNATAVLYEGDPRPLAQALGARLKAMAPLPLSDPHAVLPAQPLDTAHATARLVRRAGAAATPILGADQVVADLGDGQAVLRPAVHLLGEPEPDTLNVELPFPCVWVAPWRRNEIAPLRNSLVLTAITDDEALVDRLLAEPTITNLYVGPVPTHHSEPAIPHDGFLADFLMRNKGFSRR